MAGQAPPVSRFAFVKRDDMRAHEGNGDSASRWTALVESIQRDDARSMESLYRIFNNGIRFHLCRQVHPQDIEDTIHNSFLIVVNAIRAGDLREPERLMGFVRTIVRRQVAARIDDAVQKRRQEPPSDGPAPLVDAAPGPEQRVISEERREFAWRILSQVSGRDREILIRFYINEESQEQICHQMHLTSTQFRLLKWRAKQRFGDLGKRSLAAHEPEPIE